MENITRLAFAVLGWRATLAGLIEDVAARPRRGDRGLSQSTETALLVAAAVVVVTIITLVVKTMITNATQAANDGAGAAGLGGNG